MAVGAIETVILAILMGLPAHQMMGLPPGQRDAKLVHAAPTNSLLYTEWAERGEGTPGAPGVEGLAADPEIIQFLSSAKAAITEILVKESRLDELEVVPDLVVQLIGKPGCLYFGLDDSVPPDPNLPPPLVISQMFRAGLVVNAGDEADEIATKLQKLASIAMQQEVESLEHLTFPAPVPIQLHRHESYFVVTIGSVADDVVQRLTDSAGGIADNDGFQKAVKGSPMARTASVTYLDLKSCVDHANNISGMGEEIDRILGLLGLDKMESMTGVSGINEQGNFAIHAKLAGDFSGDGLIAKAAGSAIGKDHFAVVPADCDWATGASLDINAIKDAIFSFESPDNQDRMNRRFSEAAMMIGLEWQEDVFDVFDNVFVISNSPGDGGWIASNAVLSVKIKDQAAAAKTMIKMSAGLKARMLGVQEDRWRRRGIELVERKFQDTKLYMVNIVGDDVPMSPTWCIHGSQLLFSLHPQALKSRLRRMAADDWKTFEFDPSEQLAGDKIGFTYAKTSAVASQLYGMLPWVGAVAYSELQSEGIKTTLMDFPSAAALLPYLSDCKSYAVRTDSGFELYSEGPPVIGPAVSSLPLMGPAMFVSLAGVRRARVVEIEAVEAVMEAEAEAIELEAVEEIQRDLEPAGAR